MKHASLKPQLENSLARTKNETGVRTTKGKGKGKRNPLKNAVTRE